RGNVGVAARVADVGDPTRDAAPRGASNRATPMLRRRPPLVVGVGGALRRGGVPGASRCGPLLRFAAMDPKAIEALLAAVRDGTTRVEGALEALRALPFEADAQLTVDHHRALRTGLPEVVYGEGKSA